MSSAVESNDLRDDDWGLVLLGDAVLHKFRQRTRRPAPGAGARLML
jgi:hypothetical protein